MISLSSHLGVGRGWGFQPGPAPPPAPPNSPIFLLPPSPPPPPSKLPQNLPSSSSVLSICCLDCSLMSRLMCLNLITRARWWLCTPPSTTATELGAQENILSEATGWGQGGA